VDRFGELRPAHDEPSVPGYPATPGYDLSTGWGTPNVGQLGTMLDSDNE
jgi:hypothetical protein